MHCKAKNHYRPNNMSRNISHGIALSGLYHFRLVGGELYAKFLFNANKSLLVKN